MPRRVHHASRRAVMLCGALALLLAVGWSKPRCVAAAPPELTEAEARAAGAAFVNEALKGKTYKDATGKERPFPTLKPTSWKFAKLDGGRWRLSIAPPAGLTIVASMKADGGDPKLELAQFSAD